MAYGQIQTGSGRTLNLTQDRGWVNDMGEQLVPNSGSGGMSLADLAGRGGAQQMPDYAQPIDVGGYGKGYRVKGDPYSVMLQDGRTVNIGIDREATMARQKQALDMERAGLSNKLMEAQIAAAGRKEAPTYQHVDTPNGMMIFNPRTGELSALGGGGSGMPMQTKEQVQQSKDATSVMELTDQAAPLLKQAPGSYLGAAVNQLGRVVGMDTDASKAQAQLDVLAGGLISKMPKMSGPQSDKDVALYKAMAGNLNDPTLPTSAKEAAMKTLRLLNQKYATGYQEPAGQQPVQQPASSAPRTGMVDGGHVFLGGDPANPASWKRVQ